jgi:hypothetical protein
MIEWISDFIASLTLRNVLIGVSIFLVTFSVNLGIVSFILVKLPADYFKRNRTTQFWAGPNPAANAALVIGKNILGVFLILLGIALSLPGVPGQGLLTVLLGVMLLDFPGKTTLERKLLGRPEIQRTINKLRAKFQKPPLELE